MTRRHRFSALVSRLTRHLCRVMGMPDYAAYLRHMTSSHPGAVPLTEREFFTDYLERRYADGPTRCC